MKKLKQIITIDGIDGAGKTTFARHLCTAIERAGGRGVVISVDDFRRPVDWKHADAEVDAYYDDYYDLAMCDATLAAFRAGARSITIPAYDAQVEQLAGYRTLVLDGTFAIVEGVFPQRVPTTATGTVVFLDVDEGVARRRILERDQRRGRARDDIQHRIEHRYFPAQKRYWSQVNPRERADILIDNEVPQAPRVVRCDVGRVAEPLRSILERLLPAAAA
jgi:uridine kinase